MSALQQEKPAPIDPSPLPASLCAPLFAPLTSLRGVGDSVAALIARAAGGARVIDLLFHLPESWIDRRTRTSIREAVPGTLVTIEAEVVRIDPPGNARQPTKAVVGDGTGFADIVFFRRFPAAKLPKGGRVLISGKVDDRGQIVHPDHIVPADRAEGLPWIEPVWPLTAGLFPWHLRRPVAEALTSIPDLPEWHDPALLHREQFPGFAEALRLLHAPASPPPPSARRRLAYDELLAGQVALSFVRRRARDRPGRTLAGDGALRAQALAAFGHAPTASQTAVLAEIDADLAAPRRMLRLLQGDVGSGKTLVAVLAMLRAVEAGAQAALMAPTEILARQHHRTLAAISPVPCALLTGSVTGKARVRVLEGLADGGISLVVGTHALLQEGVAFRDLALAVIDEQHRFGVDQRLRMGGKGVATDVLVMTATPIPRTLLLTQWGEMQVSRLTDKPAGRRPVRTTLHSLATLPEVVDAVARALDRGARVYWVCPLVAESELLDLAAAEARFALLQGRFGAAVGSRAWAAGQCRARGGAGRFRRRADASPGCDDGHRGGRGRARGQRHGHRARRAVRPGAAAPVARPGRPRHRGELLPAAACRRANRDTARRRLALLRDTDDGFRHRRRGFPHPRRRRPAGHAAVGPARLAAGRPGRARGHAAHGRPGRRIAGAARPEARVGTWPGGAGAAAPVRETRGVPHTACGMTGGGRDDGRRQRRRARPCARDLATVGEPWREWRAGLVRRPGLVHPRNAAVAAAPPCRPSFGRFLRQPKFGPAAAPWRADRSQCVYIAL